MLKSELIQALNDIDGDFNVVISGYEGGVSEVSNIDNVQIVKDVHDASAWYYGRHEICDGEYDRKKYKDKEKHPAIYIS